LTWVNKQNLCTNFKREQFHLFVDKCHRRSHHFAVLKQEANNVSRCAI